MGTEYQKYLESPHWKQTRSKKRGRTRGCGICGAAESLDVHHMNYRELFDVEMSDLRVLCRTCHRFAHVLHRRGAFRFTSTDHNHRWAVLKAAVKANFRESRPRPVLMDCIVTREWLMWFATPNGGWNAQHMIALGVTWPPPKGWISGRVGKPISQSMAAAFEAAAC